MRALLEIGMSKLERDNFAPTDPLPSISVTRCHPQLGEAQSGEPMAELVRMMTLDGHRDCLRIEEDTYPTPWTEGIFLDELVSPRTRLSS